MDLTEQLKFKHDTTEDARFIMLATLDDIIPSTERSAALTSDIVDSVGRHVRLAVDGYNGAIRPIPTSYIATDLKKRASGIKNGSVRYYVERIADELRSLGSKTHSRAGRNGK